MGKERKKTPPPQPWPLIDEPGSAFQLGFIKEGDGETRDGRVSLLKAGWNRSTPAGGRAPPAQATAKEVTNGAAARRRRQEAPSISRLLRPHDSCSGLDDGKRSIPGRSGV